MTDEWSKTKALVAQISGIIVARCFKISWESMAAEYQLDGCIDKHLLRKNYFGDWNELQDAIWAFLGRCYKAKPQDALRFFHRLAHEVVVEPDHAQFVELSGKYPMVFNVASQPLSQSADTPIMVPTWSNDPFINPSGYSGNFLRLITEINKTHALDCPFAAAILSRKLIESLVVSIMQTKYGGSKPEHFRNTSNRRHKFVSVILKKFWEVFDNDLKQFSSVTDMGMLKKTESTIQRLISEFNVSVHHLGAYTTKAALDGIKADLTHVLSFLKYLDDHIS